MTNSLTAARIEIPDEPDWARMRSETGARLRSAMADHGVDALILLMNGHVQYATGVSWPLLDAGLSHVERPVAVVLADDEHPHLFLPFRSGASSEPPVPHDHLHGPVYLEFDHGVAHFARLLAELIPPGATIAVDELTGAMRRCGGHAVSLGPAAGGGDSGRRRAADQDPRRGFVPSPGGPDHRGSHGGCAEGAGARGAAD